MNKCPKCGGTLAEVYGSYFQGYDELSELCSDVECKNCGCHYTKHYSTDSITFNGNLGSY